MNTRNAGEFAHLRHTFYVCFTFVTCAGSACAAEMVLAGWSGNPLLAAAQLAAGIGVAVSIGSTRFARHGALRSARSRSARSSRFRSS